MPPKLRQRATTAITAMHAAFTMFAMGAMLGRLGAQLKMPRPDAYSAWITLLHADLIEIPFQLSAGVGISSKNFPTSVAHLYTSP